MTIRAIRTRKETDRTWVVVYERPDLTGKKMVVGNETFCAETEKEVREDIEIQYPDWTIIAIREVCSSTYTL